MPLTYREFKELIAPYTGRAGKCADNKTTDIFARQVMEYLLYSGSHAGIRKLCILAYRGCVVLPPEVENVLKAKIDHKVAEVWNKWHTFHSVKDDLSDCLPTGQVMMEDGTETPLAYDIPQGGSIVGVMATCKEDGEAFVTVQGKDETGREIYTFHNGEQIVGERFKLEKNIIRYGKVKFATITSVTKSQTNGYVTLHAINKKTKELRFLADWAPSETKPSYRKFKIISRDCPSIAHLTLLTRVRIKDTYSDNEITLFENSLAIMLAAQRIQNETNNNPEVANYKREAVEDLLEKEAGYKKTSSSGPMDVYFPLSGGAIRNII